MVANKRGGKRPGAGRKPTPSKRVEICGDGTVDAVLDVLLRMALGQIEASPTQVAAAAHYLKHRAQPSGKKAAAMAAAESVADGDFSAAPVPLRVGK